MKTISITLTKKLNELKVEELLEYKNLLLDIIFEYENLTKEDKLDLVLKTNYIDILINKKNNNIIKNFINNIL